MMEKRETFPFSVGEREKIKRERREKGKRDDDDE